MITKIFEYWFIDLLEVVKMMYPPLIDEDTIIYYAVSFFITMMFFIGLVVDIIREFFKEERYFDFVYAAMGLIAIFYVGGAIFPYAIEYFPPFG
jgi:hypothetical protein